MLVRGLTALLALTACAAPNQNNPARYGTVTVGFGPALDDAASWQPVHLGVMRRELRALNALGPSFLEANEGDAQWVVRPFDSGPRGPACELGAGDFEPGTHYVQCDPVCTQGDDGVRACMGHELGHALGMQHICLRPGETDDCSPVGYGRAMMNPTLGEGGSGVDQYLPTMLDLAEYRRTHP